MDKLEIASSLRDKVSEKIKETFTELIPDETWKKLVESELKEFVAKGLPTLIQDEFKLRYSKALKEELDKPEYQAYWTSTGQRPSEAVKEIIKP